MIRSLVIVATIYSPTIVGVVYLIGGHTTNAALWLAVGANAIILLLAWPYVTRGFRSASINYMALHQITESLIRRVSAVGDQAARTERASVNATSRVTGATNLSVGNQHALRSLVATIAQLTDRVQRLERRLPKRK